MTFQEKWVALLDAVATVAARKKNKRSWIAVVISITIAGTSLLVGITTTIAVGCCLWQKKQASSTDARNQKALSRLIISKIDSRLERYLITAKEEMVRMDKKNAAQEEKDIGTQEVEEGGYPMEEGTNQGKT